MPSSSDIDFEEVCRTLENIRKSYDQAVKEMENLVAAMQRLVDAANTIVEKTPVLQWNIEDDGTIHDFVGVSGDSPTLEDFKVYMDPKTWDS